jgi:hypothetical protein
MTYSTRRTLLAGMARFEQALDEAQRTDPSIAAADVLYAYGTKPADGHA